MVKPFFCHVMMDSKAGAHKRTSKLSGQMSFRELRMARDKSPAVQGFISYKNEIMYIVYAINHTRWETKQT
jgi:hypothetical protein